MKNLFILLFYCSFGIINAQNDSLKKQKETNTIVEILSAMAINDSAYQDKTTEAKIHYSEFNAAWEKLEEQKLSKMRVWRNEELEKINLSTQNLFYPFSGPDFLNAYLLYPECDNYLMFGLEKIGELPKLTEMKGVFLTNYLKNVRSAMSEIMSRNYFITKNMSSQISYQLKGVLPILSIFIKRFDNEILSIKKVFIEKNGKPTITSLSYQSKFNLVTGLQIIFKNKQKNKNQTVYYFSTDVQDNAMVNKPELLTFLQSFPEKSTFIKSASYLLHGANFSTMRNFILNNTKSVVQDDTGIPYQFYNQKNWYVQLFGKYARPVKDFNYGYQTDLANRFNVDKTVKPINFTFGYHWWTDKSSILKCTRPEKK
ncbi:MAG: hypothetical protein EAZ31_10645 [Cytophagia bacterium]|nr:MAG: hypothetical protein EAY69_06025 [Cytophagales bacterium]TAG38283.1 MAG: hypothetical protein EAZ31_10645 [Cytophagia bacterium]TAH29420.1 MAG: hypothetical protein EAZ06_06800 [Cytophagales bacterium]